MTSPELHDYNEVRPLPTSYGRDVEIEGDVLPADDFEPVTLKPVLSEAQVEAQVDAIIADDMRELKKILTAQESYDIRWEMLADKLGSYELADADRLGVRPEIPEYLMYLVDNA